MSQRIVDSTWWAVQWHDDNRLDGCSRHLIWQPPIPRLFFTRRECRAFIEEQFGYLRERPDLRAEPHGWHMPQAVLVNVSVASAAAS